MADVEDVEDAASDVSDEGAEAAAENGEFDLSDAPDDLEVRTVPPTRADSRTHARERARR